jgi:D-tyrosyl-tRNA(Tyr) deacylase
MRVVIQRVCRAAVDVEDQRIAAIGKGFLLLVGVAPDDEQADLAKAARKVANLRVFEDDDGRMNRSLREVEGSVLAVSQFTLFADMAKGRRPSFAGAALPERALPIFERFVSALREEGLHVEVGRFGAKMDVELVNDGPVTLIYDVETA